MSVGGGGSVGGGSVGEGGGSVGGGSVGEGGGSVGGGSVGEGGGSVGGGSVGEVGGSVGPVGGVVEPGSPGADSAGGSMASGEPENTAPACGASVGSAWVPAEPPISSDVLSPAAGGSTTNPSSNVLVEPSRAWVSPP